MTREQAIEAFRTLVRQYGFRWGAAVPREAHDLLLRINKVLDERGRREALGLRQAKDERLL